MCVKSSATLIVCPASLVHQWNNEIERRVRRGTLDVVLYHGPNRLNSATRFVDYRLSDTRAHLLSTRADRQGVDISVAVCLFVFVCFVRLRISLPRIKLVESNCAQWFIGVLGTESPILWNFAPPEAQNRTNRPATGKQGLACEDPP